MILPDDDKQQNNTLTERVARLERLMTPGLGTACEKDIEYAGMDAQEAINLRGSKFVERDRVMTTLEAIADRLQNIFGSGLNLAQRIEEIGTRVYGPDEAVGSYAGEAMKMPDTGSTRAVEHLLDCVDAAYERISIALSRIENI